MAGDLVLVISGLPRCMRVCTEAGVTTKPSRHRLKYVYTSLSLSEWSVG